MKKILLFVSLLTVTAAVHADGLIINNTSGQKNGTATIMVELTNASNSYRAVLFDLKLPQGVNVIYDEYGDPLISKGERLSGKYSVTGNHLSNGNDRFGVINTSDNEAISGETGALFSFTVALSDELTIGSSLNASVSAIKLTDTSATDHSQENFTFKIIVEEVRTILDEVSAIVPSASNGAVDVRVNRTIKANEWSTICLPFSISAAQMQTAFGDDVEVELADFKGYETVEEGSNVVGINVNFTTATAIAANHPYIIKVSKPVTEILVDGVDINPEDEPTVATVNRTRRQWSELIGTYVANTTVPEKTLFLSGNKFYYSTGATKMKAFRAYFDFYDVLTNVDESYPVKMMIDINGVETGIENMVDGQGTKDNVYDLSGRKVTKPQHRGVYIVNGKKTLIK